ncbi:MAG: hypothetical protein IIA72_21555 [Proteobacteria bacterium]|nr:hypothetical protein [Pseudomonadota bacterium]
MLANAIAMFGRCFRRGPKRAAIRTGCVYRRIRGGNTVETATVLDIHDDPFGIPHVKYKVSIGRSDRSSYWDCKRVLALQSFAELYDEIGPIDLAAGDLAVAKTT